MSSTVSDSAPLSPRPVVAVPACRKIIDPHPFHGAGEKYLRALSDAAEVAPLVVPALVDPCAWRDVLARVDGVFLTGIKQSQNLVTLEGLAESNARVSAYMRNLDASSWLRGPRLELIEATEEERVSTFKLHLQQTTPKEEEELDKKKAAQQET